MRKVIDNGEQYISSRYTHISGSNRPIQIEYAKPEWSEEQEPYFRFMGNRHYLGNIERYSGKGYDGCESWSYSNGMLVKFSRDCESVYAYYFYTSSQA